MCNDICCFYDVYMVEVVKLNGVSCVDIKFLVNLIVQQCLEIKIQEFSQFLFKVNIYGVLEQEGEKIGFGVFGFIVSMIDIIK